MSFTITIIRQETSASGQPIIVRVDSEIEAFRIAQEGSMIAKRRADYVTYEVHNERGQLVASFTSAFAEA